MITVDDVRRMCIDLGRIVKSKNDLKKLIDIQTKANSTSVFLQDQVDHMMKELNKIKGSK